jgi:hypothetical protein
MSKRGLGYVKMGHIMGAEDSASFLKVVVFVMEGQTMGMLGGRRFGRRGREKKESGGTL